MNDAIEQAIRDSQFAMISRWIRNGDEGWIFLGPGRKGYHLVSDEAASLEEEARAIVETWIVERRIVNRRLKLFWPLLFAPILLPAALTFWLGASFDDTRILVIAGPIISFAFLSAYLLPPDVRYLARIRRWRAEAAKDCREQGRMATDALALKRFRPNLFVWLHIAAACAFFGWILFRSFVLQTEGFAAWEIILGAVIILSQYPARRIDATHRRRKWLD